ncbi:MAG: KTSC domain-containing protein [Patescibacteria group bacterium]|nr:KTSC domain-containing protein [Patescibacteria group bacterium]
MVEIPVSSSLILAAAYDDVAQELHVTFKNGARWIYGNSVRPFTAEDAALFEGAASKGQWFLQQIKGQWPERRA